MKLQTKENLELEIVTHMIDEDTPNTEVLVLKKGEIIDVDIISQEKDIYNEVQFGDGSVCFQLYKKYFSEVR
jgi:hypothetical protein